MLQAPNLQIEPLYFLTHLLHPPAIFLIITDVLLLSILHLLRLLFDQ